MTKIAHIINPVKVKESSDLLTAQPITFQSMLNAKSYGSTEKNIELCCTQYPEDESVIPDGFKNLGALGRSVEDVNPKTLGRKLPLIKDILDKLITNVDADYYIYTNVDIGLMPSFYSFVQSKIDEGYDALIINRRRLKKEYKSVGQLPEIYADLGKSHPGFDCFVFSKAIAQKLVLGDICIGAPFIGVAMAHNLFSFAEKALFVPDAHLTFHIGEQVMVEDKSVYHTHNQNEFENVVFPALKPFFDVKKFPYAELPLYERALKWMLNPSLFTKNFISEEQKSLKSKLDELRWRILQR